jgi:hypothetical protein
MKRLALLASLGFSLVYGSLRGAEPPKAEEVAAKVKEEYAALAADHK